MVLAAYKVSARFPRSEAYGLTSQIRRAAASVPANIAEGCGRNSTAELARFLEIAQGSASELEYHLLLAHDLSLIDDHDHAAINALLTEVRKMLSALITRLRTTNPKTQRSYTKLKTNH